MKRNTILTVALAAVLGMAGLTALAQTPGAGTGQGRHWAQGPGGPGRMHGLFANALGLTDAQKQQIKTIFQSARQTAQPIRQQLQPLRNNLQAAVKTNDSAAIQTAVNAMAPLETQLKVIRANAMAQAYQVLTPDQKTKAEELKNNFKNKMKQRFGQGGEGGQSAPPPLE